MKKGTVRECLAALDSIDLVIFDCDGVLIDSEVISANVIVKKLAAQGQLTWIMLTSIFSATAFRVWLTKYNKTSISSCPMTFDPAIARNY